MHKYILTILLSGLLLVGNTFGQDRNKRAQIEALKVQFITKHLSLSADEAKTFWPVFNQFEAEKKAIRQAYRSRAGLQRQNIDQLTDGEAEALIASEIDFKEKDLAITKKYVEEFKKVLTIKKVAILLTLENKFKQHLIRLAKDK